MKRSSNVSTTNKQQIDPEKHGKILTDAEFTLKTPGKTKKALQRKRIRIDSEAFNTESDKKKHIDPSQ